MNRLMLTLGAWVLACGWTWQGAAQEAVVLPSFLPAGAETQALLDGNHDAARLLIEPTLEAADHPRPLPARLYLYGLSLASPEADADRLRDAALAQMRVVVHYQDRNHPMVPFALLEAADVHLRLGLVADARRLFDTLTGMGGIGASTEPAYHSRMQALGQRIEAAE